MSSLFAGLFSNSGGTSAKSSLFSEKSAFRDAANANPLSSSNTLYPTGTAASTQPNSAVFKVDARARVEHPSPEDDAIEHGGQGKKKKKKVARDVLPEQEQSPLKQSKKKRAAEGPAGVEPEQAPAVPEPLPKTRVKRQQAPPVTCDEAQAQAAPAPAEHHAEEPAVRRPSARDAVEESEDEDLRPQTAASRKKKLTEEEVAARDQQNVEKLARTLFVGNLPLDTTTKELKKLFSRLGYPVESARLRSVPIDPQAQIPRRGAILTGKIRRDSGAGAASAGAGNANGYVVLVDAADVDSALSANMSEYKGHHIRVDRAAPPRTAGSRPASGEHVPGGIDAPRSIFIGNLDFLIKDEAVIKFFSDARRAPELHNAVEAVRLVRDKQTNIGKGFGFVMFRTKEAARAARALDGHQIGKRDVRITRVTKMAPAAAPAPRKRTAGAAGDAAGHRDEKDRKRNKPDAGDSSKAADWQGLRTKGKGQGLRGPKVSKAPPRAPAAQGSGGPSGAPPPGKQRGSKRPAVAARKEAAAQKRKAATGGNETSQPRVKKPRTVPRHKP